MGKVGKRGKQRMKKRSFRGNQQTQSKNNNHEDLLCNINTTSTTAVLETVEGDKQHACTSAKKEWKYGLPKAQEKATNKTKKLS